MGDDLGDEFSLRTSSKSNHDEDKPALSPTLKRPRDKNHDNAEDNEEEEDADAGPATSSSASASEKKKKKKKKKKKTTTILSDQEGLLILGTNDGAGNDGDASAPTASADAIAASFSKLLRRKKQLDEMPGGAESDADGGKKELTLLASDVVLLPAQPTSSAARSARDSQLAEFVANVLRQHDGTGDEQRRQSTEMGAIQVPKPKQPHQPWKRRRSAAADSACSADKGRPRCVVVAMSALRCCALVPLLRQPPAKKKEEEDEKSAGKQQQQRQKQRRVARLFSKHMKVAEQAALLRKEPFDVAVGTPHRLGRLLLQEVEGDAPPGEEAQAQSSRGAQGKGKRGKGRQPQQLAPPLSLEACEVLVLDASFADAKQFTLLSLKDVKDDLLQLFHEHVLPELARRRALERDHDGGASSSSSSSSSSSASSSSSSSPPLRVAFV